MQGKSGRGERETRNGREKEGKRKERRTERQTRKCSERTLNMTLHWSAMATATATEKEAGAASSGGRGSARCTAPMSHAGQGTATENAAEIVVFVRLKNEALEICLVCWAPDHLVSLDRRISTLDLFCEPATSALEVWFTCSHLVKT